MTRSGRIAVLGEALVDVVQRPDGPPRAAPGGSGLNTSLALARLDAPVAFAGALSQDAEGQGLARFLADEGVDVTHAIASAKPCPRVIARPGADGSPVYEFHIAGSALEQQPRDWRAPDGMSHLHATSFASTVGAGGVAALEALRAARAVASTSFDPNIRRALLPPTPQARALIAERVAQTDIVKVSAEDLALLEDDNGALLRGWLTLGPTLVVVTRGADGARGLFAGGEVDIASPSVLVRDTIGAGDTFMAALLAQMREDGALGLRAQVFTAEQVARWLAFAARAAALCCARDGCDPPRRAELQASP